MNAMTALLCMQVSSLCVHVYSYDLYVCSCLFLIFRRAKMSGASRSVESDPSEGSFEQGREGIDLRRREVEVALEMQRRSVGIQVNMDEECSGDA